MTPCCWPCSLQAWEKMTLFEPPPPPVSGTLLRQPQQTNIGSKPPTAGVTPPQKGDSDFLVILGAGRAGQGQEAVQRGKEEGPCPGK